MALTDSVRTAQQADGGGEDDVIMNEVNGDASAEKIGSQEEAMEEGRHDVVLTYNEQFSNGGHFHLDTCPTRLEPTRLRWKEIHFPTAATHQIQRCMGVFKVLPEATLSK